MNLWTGIDDNHQVLPAATGQERSRRVTERAVLYALREWLLRDYVAAYCRSLAATRIFRRCYWIDALGIDGRSLMPAQPSNEAEDSISSSVGRKRKKANSPAALPLVLQSPVALAQKLAHEQPPITLHALVFALGSSRSGGRKESAAQADGANGSGQSVVIPRESAVVQASWLDMAPLVLKEIEQTPAIFLLNPFGPAMFSSDDLTLLYQRSVPTELCLLVSHKQVAACLRAARQKSERAAAMTTLMRTDRWKTLPIEDKVEQAISDYIALFIKSMTRHFSLPVQSISLPIQIGPAVVAALPYTLIFATRRQDSLLCMNDAVCGYHRRVEEESYRGVLGEEWFAAQLHARRQEELRQLYDFILQHGKARRSRRWPELRQQALLAHFGQFALQDYELIVQQLLANGVVRCEWRHPRTENEEPLPPGPDETLIWN